MPADAHLALGLAESRLEVDDFLVVTLLTALVGLLQLFLICDVLLKGLFSLLKLPLDLLILVVTILGERLR